MMLGWREQGRVEYEEGVFVRRSQKGVKGGSAGL